MTADLVELVARHAFERGVENGHRAGYTGPRMTWEGESDALREDWRRIILAALSALEAAGYRVVPVEPTEAMCEAGENSGFLMWSPEPGEGLDGADMETAWTAMLAAAPKVGST